MLKPRTREGTEMRRIIVTVGAALIVTVPAAIGLIGNTSFAQSVPVRLPPQATVADDHGGRPAASTPEPGEDHGGQRSITEPCDDQGGQRITEPGDDHCGQPGTSTTGPGKDRRTITTEPGNDHGGQPTASTTAGAGLGATGAGLEVTGSGKSSGSRADSGARTGDNGHGRSGASSSGGADGPGHG